MTVNAEDVGDAILETMPLIMRSVRADIEQRVGRAITLAQLRVLSHLRKGDWCLSDLAAHQKVSMATMSKMVSGLVDRGYIERSYESQDRRFIVLRLTPKGRRFFDEAYAYSRTLLAGRAAALSAGERERIVASLKRLQPLFEDDETHRRAPAAPAPSANGAPSTRRVSGRHSRSV